MKSAYLITDKSTTFDCLVKCLSDLHLRPLSDDHSIFIKTTTKGDYQFLRIEEESLSSLLDEWYPEDPIIQHLLHLPAFDGQSRAFYVTMSDGIKESTLLKAVVSNLVHCAIPFFLFDCIENTVEGRLASAWLEASP
jgi:hypothetical protein